ncbi:hypothetical protein [Paenibacillus donghaensis]|uniref:Uncharacterized protein n=1 Tax=Paenibacillus donghaensis TaxID=414771 RepID=A0A2Z2KW69_9BACL|nr:hypothetical protein [Paenibacillus donghaensis]ASA25661.1 hypothetical protein B9T62_35985 [Paenibacillus donghaensis]
MNIRDKFNLLSANTLKDDDDYFIQREWKNRDLAVIKHKNDITSPAALFEFKARYTHYIARNSRDPTGVNNLFRGDGGKKDGVLQDIEKVKKYTDYKVPCYHILIGVHPLESIPSKYHKFGLDCTEIDPINSSFKKFGNEARIKELCYSNVKRFCREQGHDFFALEYNIGKALDIEWEMLLWVSIGSLDSYLFKMGVFNGEY